MNLDLKLAPRSVHNGTYASERALQSMRRHWGAALHQDELKVELGEHFLGVLREALVGDDDVKVG